MCKYLIVLFYSLKIRLYTSHHVKLFYLLTISVNYTHWIVTHDKLSDKTSLICFENIAMYSRTIFTVHGSMSMYKCTIQTDLFLINLKSVLYETQDKIENGFHSFLENHMIKIVKSFFKGSMLGLQCSYVYNVLQGNIFIPSSHHHLIFYCSSDRTLKHVHT